MNMRPHDRKRLFVMIITTAVLVGYLGYWPKSVLVAGTRADDAQDDKSWSFADATNGFVIIAGDTGASCREATSEESRYFDERDPSLTLQSINDFRVQADEGLHITLRSTPQLDSFPDAKAAFLRAAAVWESLIQSRITIIIDVDFGPMRFGQTYPQGVIGSTGTQSLFNSIGYISLRSRLITGTTDPQKSTLYGALPNPNVPTDIGNTSAVVAPSATLRMIGEINPVADPTAEPGFGNPPAIGFNSAFAFDFDPSNGIDADKIDFDSVAVHEIGHALGFTSQEGARELGGNPLAVSVWDIFRFRPGISSTAFTSAPRILSSGGDQVFYSLGNPLALSTGRPDGSGGDGRQPSHWKDDSISSQYLGIMDPSIRNGFRGTITANDLAALDAMGYVLKGTVPPPPPGGNNAPAINSVTGALNGQTLTVRVGAADLDGDLAQAQLALLNDANAVLHQPQPIILPVDASTTRNLTLDITSMGLFPTAVKVSVALVDSRGNRSATSTLDFSQADAGGPDVRNVVFDGEGVMTIKGGPFGGVLQLEINGVLIGPAVRIKVKGSGAKLKIAGSQSDLNLRSGANRVRLLSDGLRSKIFVLSI